MSAGDSRGIALDVIPEARFMVIRIPCLVPLPPVTNPMICCNLYLHKREGAGNTPSSKGAASRPFRQFLTCVCMLFERI